MTMVYSVEVRSRAPSPNERKCLMATQTNTPAFKLTAAPKKVLLAYLRTYTSGAADAPHQGLPFIDGKDNVRVKPDHFEEWFMADDVHHQGQPTTREVRQVLKDAGLTQ